MGRDAPIEVLTASISRTRCTVEGHGTPLAIALPRWEGREMRSRQLENKRFALIVVVLLAGGCGGSDSGGAESVEKTTAKTSAKPKPSLVGRWQLIRTCESQVAALRKAGLAALAPSVAGDYFPGMDPAQLAKKRKVCAGAHAAAHSHFFTKSGEFGSLDENGERVDDGTYRLIDADTFRIDSEKSVTFDYQIESGNRLSLRPVITPKMRREALANPLEFSAAGWALAVAIPGRKWKRIPCDGAC